MLLCYLRSPIRSLKIKGINNCFIKIEDAFKDEEVKEANI